MIQCAACGKRFDRRSTAGRIPLFCSDRCRKDANQEKQALRRVAARGPYPHPLPELMAPWSASFLPIVERALNEAGLARRCTVKDCGTYGSVTPVDAGDGRVHAAHAICDVLVRADFFVGAFRSVTIIGRLL